MRNIKLVVFLLMGICSCTLSKAQTPLWFDIGVKAGSGTSWIFNRNIFYDRTLDEKYSPAYSIGGKVGFNFSESVEITLDVLFSKNKQRFRIKDLPENEGFPLISEINWITLDFPLLFRSNSRGTYVELGPQLSLVRKATSILNNVSGDQDINTEFSDYYLSGVFGFGGFIAGSDVIGLTMGLRFSYSFQDILSNEGRASNFPTGKEYNRDRKTTAFFALIVSEIYFDFGFLANPRCSKRSKFIF